MTDWDDEERAALDGVRDELRAVQERHRNDPRLDLLRAARADALPEPLREAAADHLARSAWSRTLVDGADEADAAIDRAAEDRILGRVMREARSEGKASRRFGFWIWAPALSAAIVVLAVLVVRRPAPTPQTAAVVTPAPAATTPPTPPSARFHLPLDKPDVRFTATALVLRGEAGGRRFVDLAAPAIRAYRDGDYATAASDFAALEPRFPQSVEVPFYLGVSRLFLGDTDGARQAFAAARRVSDDSFRPGIDWYSAIADERAGRASDARAVVDRLCAGSSEYRDRACAAAPLLPTK